MFFLSVILSFVASWSAVLAAPSQSGTLSVGKVLEVIDPKILQPDASTVWVVGSTYQVTWDTKDLPPLTNITNVVGMLILGQYNGNGEKLDFDNPLADGFLLTDGQVSITVPAVRDGNYTVVLFGDSGNTSPQFKIVNGPLSSITDPASSTVSPSSQSSASMSSSSSTSASASRAETSPSVLPSSASSSAARSPMTSGSSSQPLSAPFKLSNSPSPTSTSPTNTSPTTSQPPSPTGDPNSAAANGALSTSNVPIVMCLGLVVFISLLAL